MTSCFTTNQKNEKNNNFNKSKTSKSSIYINHFNNSQKFIQSSQQEDNRYSKNNIKNKLELELYINNCKTQVFKDPLDLCDEFNNITTTIENELGNKNSNSINVKLNKKKEAENSIKIHKNKKCSLPSQYLFNSNTNDNNIDHSVNNNYLTYREKSIKNELDKELTYLNESFDKSFSNFSKQNTIRKESNSIFKLKKLLIKSFNNTNNDSKSGINDNKKTDSEDNNKLSTNHHTYDSLTTNHIVYNSKSSYNLYNTNVNNVNNVARYTIKSNNNINKY